MLLVANGECGHQNLYGYRTRLYIAHPWFIRVDEVPAQGRLNFFDSGSDNTKPKLWKELGLVSVGEL